MPDPSLEAAYRSTDYRVEDAPGGPFAIRVGQACPELDRLLAEMGEADWAYVTACNPGSVRLADDENARRTAELEALVRAGGWRFFRGHGVGRDGGWPPEPSLLILGMVETEEIDLGRRFGQNAVVAGRVGQVARLVWVE